MGYSLITTGRGNDKVVGTGNVSAGTAIGINNENGVIDTGSDSDVVLGIANVITSGSAWGIYGGDINTGDGSDKVIAFAAVNGEQVDGFGGGVNVDLGAGRDFLAGFGEGTFSGGSGLDILSLRGYSIDEFTINIIDRDTSAVNFSIGDVTMVTEQFELFIFNDFIARGIGELPQPV